MKTVLCNGCWDLLHLGHIRHLKEAKSLGDTLVVSVTSDKYVNKGPGRPRFTEDERAEALMALSFVDRVLVNHSPDAVDLIKHLKPTAYVKGSDYCGITDDEVLVREAEAIAEVGGDMVFTGTQKWSSTDLLNSLPKEPYADYVYAFSDIEADESFDRILSRLIAAKRDQRRIFFIGNGGSAAIASHFAADFLKAAKMAALSFNEPALMSAIANDVAYSKVFSGPLAIHGHGDDILFAISSSGESDSIIKAVTVAGSRGMAVITLSGFKPTNRLRGMGDVNLYVPSDRYGVVEAAHFVILHSLLDAVVEDND
jgi:D-sedoheptulose 7-phosphate isomerase